MFAAGKAAGLKVVAQMAVGFDNIDRAAANAHKIPFSNTADVLTDATAEFAFLIMGCAARMTWPSEQMVREQTWSTWHPWHPWLGDEVTGKTVAVIGTGRIGKSFIKKAVGFDMDVLCYDPAFQDAHVRGGRAPRHEGAPRGRARRARLQTIEYVPFEEALRPRRLRLAARDPHAARASRRSPPTTSWTSGACRLMKPTALPREHLARAGGGRDTRWPRRCARAGSAAPRWTCSRRSRCRPTARCATSG